MSKIVLSLFLLTAASLTASDGLRAKQQMNDCTDAACDSCYAPICPNCSGCSLVPSFNDLQCNWGFSLDVEFLYWYAKEQQVPIAEKARVRNVINDDGLFLIYLLPKDEITMGSRWDPGVRAAIGYNSCCDGWDTYLLWTYVHNKKKKRESVRSPVDGNIIENHADGTTLLISPWDYYYPRFTFEDEAPIYTKVSGEWRLDYNVVDLELGKKYWLSECFNLRPFAAVRGVWSEIIFDVTNIIDFQTDPDLGTKITFNNWIWGVGLVGGLEPTWYFCRCYAIYAGFDVALLWGEDRVRRKERLGGLDFPPTRTILIPSYESTSRIDGMQAGIDLSLGLRYEDTFCCHRYRFTIDLGWEHHALLNYVHKFKVAGVENHIDSTSIERFFTDFDWMENDLALGGLVFRLRFDF
ncbi:MAG: hypothetical protein KR126chlam1_00234 [Chlamydiae bacterium]|nr:hypothetical protein [Chlamydiota bacterium]